jgi:hypothetical protein
MSTGFSLLLLSEKAIEILENLHNLDVLDMTENTDKVAINLERTRLKHQLGDIKFSIEVLETYLD